MCGAARAVPLATTASDGTYTISGIPDDTYLVLVDATEQGYLRLYYDNAAASAQATLVTVAGGAVSGIDFALGTGGTITGFVLQTGTSNPVVGAAVSVRDINTLDLVGRAITDSNGEYTVTGLSAGSYRVMADASSSGYSPLFYNNTPESSRATAVVVGQGATVSNIDFSLSAGGSISGTVYQTDGTTAVVGAFVRAHDPSPGGANGDAVSGADGTYTIPSLPDGSYIVEAQAADQGLGTEFYDNVSDWSEATRVSVSSGADVPSIDFSLGSGGSISGRITQSDGTTPIGDVFVHASDYDTGAYASGATSAADGTYTIQGLLPGDYRIETWVPEELSFAQEFYQETTDYQLAAPVMVSLGTDTPSIIFTLSQGGSVAGTVYEADGTTPIANVDISANSYDGGGGGGWANTASDGSYVIRGLVPGDYRIQARGSTLGYAQEFYQETSDYQQAARVTVVSGQTKEGINFTLGQGGSVTGTVYEADGTTPIANADVWANGYEEGGGNGYARTASDGTYMINGLQTGDYRVEARGAGFAREFYNGTSDYNAAARVAVTAGVVTTGTDFLPWSWVGPSQALSTSRTG